MAQKPVLRGEVGCACVAREVSVESGGMGERVCKALGYAFQLRVRFLDLPPRAVDRRRKPVLRDQPTILSNVPLSFDG